MTRTPPNSARGRRASKDKPALAIPSAYDASFSGDGALLAVCGRGVTVLDVPGGKAKVKCEAPKHPGRLALRAEGDSVAILSTQAILAVCDTATGKELWNTRIADEEVFSGLCFSPEGDEVITGNEKRNQLCVWSACDGSLVRSYDLDGPVESQCFSADGKTLALLVKPQQAGGKQIYLSLWDWPVGRERHRVTLAATYGSEVALSPDLSLAAIRHDGCDCTVLDLTDGLVRQNWHSPEYRKTRFSPDGAHLVVAKGNFVQVFETSTFEKRKELELKHACSISFSPDGTWAALGSWGKGQLWETTKLLGK